MTLRGLTDYKGDELVSRFMALIDEHRPLHVSIVGGEPLVRYRELTKILPQLAERGVHTQVVTSAVRQIPQEWIGLRRCRSSCRSTACSPSTTSAASRPPTTASSSTSRVIRSPCTAR